MSTTPEAGWMNGPSIADTVGIGEMTLKNVIIAVIENGSADFPIGGILGLGFQLRYSSLLDVLNNTGHIKSHMFSLYLDDVGGYHPALFRLRLDSPLGASSGFMVFGGYDKAKLTGHLSGTPISIANGQSFPSILVSLLNVFLADESGYTTVQGLYPAGLSAVLDTGSPIASNLPNETYCLVVHHIESFGHNITRTQTSISVVDCRLRKAVGSIDLVFANTTDAGADGYSDSAVISVPMSELVLQEYGNDARSPSYWVGLNNGGSGDSIVVGNFLLQSIYMIYELTFTYLGSRSPDSTSLSLIWWPWRNSGCCS